MARALQFPFLWGIPLLPASRVIGIDPGNRCIKLVLAERCFNRLRILQNVQLECPGWLGDAQPSETAERLAAALEELGPYPIALALPQHRTLSQVVDLPPVERSIVARLIQNEVYKLSGLGQSRVAYDHAPLQPFGRHQHAYWVSLCQESEVLALAERLGLNPENICGATSAGNALINSYLAQFPETTATVLVNAGLRSTTVAILLEGQGVHLASFPLGGELFIETVANALNLSLEQAEQKALHSNLLHGPDAVPALRKSVDNWLGELMRVFHEWHAEQGVLAPPAEAFQFVLTGCMAEAPWFAAHLNRTTGRPVFGPWPEREAGVNPIQEGRFAIARGVAAQALGKARQSAALLPMEARQHWQKQREAQLFQTFTFLLLLLAGLVLGMGSWQKSREEARLMTALETAQNAQARVRALKELSRQHAENVLRLHPLLEREQFTDDTLRALAWLSSARTTQSWWYVLFADTQTYMAAPPAMETTAATNAPVTLGPMPPAEVQPPTNRPPYKPGFVAELCIPEEGEALRRSLSQTVAALQRNPRFKNVDTVPPEQRRALAEPKALLPNPERHFALLLELATNEFLTVSSPATNPPPASASAAAAVAPSGSRPARPIVNPERQP
ncbi:MAG: pilus assembly protein PilM [Verrucomicrobiae bacterium]|nr:pilus assembly protein PilM [Verrucomicrobiae bacterium]